MAADFYDRLAAVDPSADVPEGQLNVRLKSSADAGAFDLDVLVRHTTARSPDPAEAVVRCRVLLVQPTAQGSVTIRSADPAMAPIIETGFGVSHDIEASARGVEWVRQRMHDRRVESWIDTEVIPGIEVRGTALRGWSRANVATRPPDRHMQTRPDS